MRSGSLYRLPSTVYRLSIGMTLVSAIMACGGASSGSSGAAGAPAPAGSAGATATTATAAPARPRRGNANLITNAEIVAGNFRDAFEIVERLRPQLVMDRAGSPAPTVYQDNVSLGTLASLRQIPATSVKEIRYINASDAATRWGTGNPGGVILVITAGR